MDLNLVHLHKFQTDITAAVLDEHTLVVHTVMSYPYDNLSGNRPDVITCSYKENRDFNDDWYLLEPRWLEARPGRCEANPLADLAYLFPKLKCLTLAPTQLTGPMLLRMLFRSGLQDLCLVQVGMCVLTCTFLTINILLLLLFNS